MKHINVLNHYIFVVMPTMSIFCTNIHFQNVTLFYTPLSAMR